MGSGATLVDGVRRWFQRRTTTSKPINTNPNNPNPNPSPNNNNHDYIDDADITAQSSACLQKEELQFQVEDDFDISGLKLIRVPKRAHHPNPAPPPPPPPIMEKKVRLSSSSLHLMIWVLI